MVVPDANVLIHGKALPDLPWTELGRPRIEVVLVPPVIRELDKLKNESGRQNKIARQLSSEVRKLLNVPDCRAIIRQSAPEVTKRLELSTLTTVMHEGLKLDHADQALINYSLYLQQNGCDVLLLTDDTICCTTAQEFGLPAKLLPEHWLRDPEPDETLKENAKLKAEIARLAAAEPKVLLGFRDAATGEALSVLKAEIIRWPALSQNEVNALMNEVQQRCPPATTFERPGGGDPGRLLGSVTALQEAFSALQGHMFYQPVTKEEIEQYKNIDYPNWLDKVRTELGLLDDRLIAQTEWPTALAIASNGGSRPATDVLLRIEARGALAIFDDSPRESQDHDLDDGAEPGAQPQKYRLPLPPVPPRGRRTTFNYGFAEAALSPRHRNFPIISPPAPRRSDAFYWRCGRHAWGKLVELECASWRHTQEELVFPLKVLPQGLSDVAGAIELSIHANNISDPPIKRLPIRITVVDGSTIDEARALVEQLSRASPPHTA
ncbi:PIN domain-containing protein [Bradyrhizobium sp. PMVTL-01]|uniref:PIN domain-containing protein n=1 Tax=Bradyrhizobium sp. PMVTL-01 TaxID=3434999 RepID=UPI003F714A1A